jgi:hypothetical protein
MDLPLADAFDTGGKWSPVVIDNGSKKGSLVQKIGRQICQVLGI